MYLKEFLVDAEKIADKISEYGDVDSKQPGSVPYQIYKYLQSELPQSKFRMTYDYQEYESLESAIETFDGIIADSLQQKIDFDHFLPSLIARIQYMYKLYFE